MENIVVCILHRMRTPLLALALGVASVALAAQGFEVASVKPTDAIQRGGGSAGLQPGGRFVLKNGPVRVLISMAFQTQTNEIVGAPDWVTYGEHFDVDARAGREITYPELGPLLRNLLADRFKMQSHIEKRVRPMYELRLARSDGKLGPQMQPASDPACVAREDGCTTRGGDNLIDSNGMSMIVLASWLAGASERPVIEKTGLSGRYALRLQYSRLEGTDLPSLPTALREQLGLTLEPIQAPADVIVIDHIERPTPD